MKQDAYSVHRVLVVYILSRCCKRFHPTVPGINTLHRQTEGLVTGAVVGKLEGIAPPPGE